MELLRPSQQNSQSHKTSQVNVVPTHDVAAVVIAEVYNLAKLSKNDVTLYLTDFWPTPWHLVLHYGYIFFHVENPFKLFSFSDPCCVNFECL